MVNNNWASGTETNHLAKKIVISHPDYEKKVSTVLATYPSKNLLKTLHTLRAGLDMYFQKNNISTLKTIKLSSTVKYFKSYTQQSIY